jgi:hypothetical protein
VAFKETFQLNKDARADRYVEEIKVGFPSRAIPSVLAPRAIFGNSISTTASRRTRATSSIFTKTSRAAVSSAMGLLSSISRQSRATSTGTDALLSRP